MRYLFVLLKTEHKAKSQIRVQSNLGFFVLAVKNLPFRVGAIILTIHTRNIF